VRAVAKRLERREGLIDELFVYVQEAVPSPATAGDPFYQAGLQATVAALVRYTLAAIEHGPEFSESVPAEVAEQARRAARAATSPELVVRRYIAGHRRLGEIVQEQARRAGLDAHPPTMAMLHSVRETLLEQTLAVVVQEHEAERARIVGRGEVRSAQQWRTEIVTELLCGATPTPQQQAALGYQLEAWHLGLVAIGADARSTVNRIFPSPSRDLIALVRSETLVWAWLGSRVEIPLARIEGALLALPADTDVVVAAGEPAWGCEGMKRTHRQAQAAAAVAPHHGSRLTSFAEVALEASALQDPALGDALIARWLVPLDGPRDGGAQRRGVLRALIAAEGNRSAAAQALGIDRETIRRRLTEIEQRLGRRLSECQAEVDVALRVEQLRTRKSHGAA
jgi:hypothetical protein